MKRIFKLSTLMIVIVILFVATNFYLLLKDDSPVARSVYIDQWTSAKEQNLIETKRTEGVTIPLEEQPVYYDMSKGSFEGFVVKKGKWSHLEHPFFSTLRIPIKMRLLS